MLSIKKIDPARFSMIFIFIFILSFLMYNLYWKDIKISGFYNSDEGYYIQIVKTYFYGIEYFKNFIFGDRDLGTLKDYLTLHGGPFFHSARQGYILLIAGISSLFLKDYYFYHGLQWSAFFGILSIILVFFFTFRNLGIVSALVSTSLFTLSPIHISFARSVHTVTMSTFFLLLGIICYFESYRKDKFLKFSAICFGLAFSCHYNLFWIFPIVFLVELYNVLKKAKKEFIRIKNFIIYSLLPLIAIEILTLSARIVLQRYAYFRNITEAGRPGYLDYFSDLIAQFITYRGYSEVEQGSFFYYFNFISQQHSWLFVAMALLGLGIIIHKFLKSKDGRLFFLALIFLPFLFYSFIFNKADKMIVSFIPIFSIYAGIIPFFLKGKTKHLAVIALVYILLYQFSMSKRCLDYQMDISEALTYMQERKGIKHLSSWMYISQAYVGKQNAMDDFFKLGPMTGESGKRIVCLSKLQDIYNNGFHYYLCYWDSNHKLAKIARQIEPEAVYYRYYNVGGHYKRIPNLGRDSARRAFEIYDIKKIMDYMKGFDEKC